MGLGSALLLIGCSSPNPGGLTNADIPSDLGVKMNASALVTVVGVGFDAPLPIGPKATCAHLYETVFIPPRKKGEALGGEGEPLTYPEVLSIGFRCSGAPAGRLGFRALSEGRKQVGGIGDQAALFNATDTQGYPKSRVYIVDWREGAVVGVVGVAGPTSNTRIGPGLAELLARRAAARS